MVPKKKYIKLILTEALCLLAFAAILTVIQFFGSLMPLERVINRHIKEAKALIEQYQNNELETEDVIEAIYQARTDLIAYAIAHKIGGPPTREHLQEYTRLLHIGNLYIVNQEDEVLVSAYDKPDFKDPNNWEFAAQIDDERDLYFRTGEIFNGMIDQYDDAISWENGITGITVGETGRVFVCNDALNEVVAHPDTDLIGSKVKFDVNPLEFRDKKEEVKAKYLRGYHLVILKKEIMMAKIFPVAVNEEYSINEYVVCAMPIQEILQNFFENYGISFGLFFTFTMMFFGFVFFSLKEKEKQHRSYRYSKGEEDEGGEARLEEEGLGNIPRFKRIGKYVIDTIFAQKLAAYTIIGGIFCLLAAVYMFQLSMLSAYSVMCQVRAEETAEKLKRYDKMTDAVKRLYGYENLYQCKLIQKLLEEDPSYETREHLKELADLADVDYIYIFNKNGKVRVTNSPYDRFKLSKKKDSQSYEFRPLLQGVEYVIQDPRKDDVSGRLTQYVGVSRRNENDLADGFLQISVSPKRLEKILESIDVSSKIGSVSVASNGFGFAVNTKTNTVVYSNNEDLRGESPKKIGLQPYQMKDGFNGFIKLRGESYYASVADENDDILIFVVVPRSDFRLNKEYMILIVTAASAACMLLLGIVGGVDRYSEQSGGEEPGDDRLPVRGSETGDGSRNTSKKNQSSFAKKLLKSSGAVREAGKDDETGMADIPVLWNRKIDEKLEERWNADHVPWEKKSPEQKIISIAKRGLLLFCIGIAWLYFFGYQILPEHSLMLFILSGKWEQGFNLLAVTACLLIICVTYVIVKCMVRLLYMIARVSGPKTETICHLLRSIIKFASPIAILYYCLAQFGINTRTLVASAGIFSLVVGLGAQGLVMDVLAGLFIVFENQFSIGDLVMVDGWMGYVTEIGIRTTKIAFYKDVRCFNNSDIKDARNFSTEEIVVVTREMGISYGESIERVKKIFKRELPLMKERIVGAVDEPRYFGIVRLEDSAIIVRFEVACASEVRLRAESTFYRELLLMYEHNNIEVPFPQLTVHEET